ncbi:hypothetical protein PSHT_09787 [Puccinia striiformis]|uniref:Something about silencing protein 4 domain-containing protein n=3 Tax=Puccinia striiformis TaxID=27350 RepID=A0A2S4VEA9_9BASI|nr:hypothetical protein PSTT_13929 [Puccinia striiformis]POW07849.1 hypothetical protein PSHT_09787 [Puccinia striiformis]
MDSGSRRLTRSTYIGEPIPSNGSSNNRKRRSSSTDSENGWIPPPPLLPLATKFLITNTQSPVWPPATPVPSTSADPVSTQIAVAHLKCQPSSNPNCMETTPNLSTTFRVLSAHELIAPPSSKGWGSIEQNEKSCSEFMTIETKFFTQRHRQSEMIEKRSKKLEKEKLLHERFKLKNCLDLLMNGSGPDWKSIRTLTLRRIKEEEMRERSAGNLPPQSDHLPRESEFEKVERMRRIMIQETQETLKRYDKLLDTRKVLKPMIYIQHSEQTPSTPSKSQSKSNKPRPSPKAPKRKLNNQTCMDQDHPQNGKLAVHPPSPKQKHKSSSIKHKHQPNHSTNKLQDLPRSDVPQSASSSSPITLPQSPHAQTVQSAKTDEPPPRSRESLYDSQLIRRLAMDDYFVNGQKRVGRSTYALGCKIPDMNKIQLDYLNRLQAMPSERRVSPGSTPFDRPERAIPIQQEPTSRTSNPTQSIDEEDDNDWIEFNPTVNEEKQIISHQASFGPGSQFFDLDEELEYLEEKQVVNFHQNHLSKVDIHTLNENSLLQLMNGGKSIRQLIKERISNPKD